MNKYISGLIWAVCVMFTGINTFSQELRKTINEQYQSWTSINTTVRLTNHWGFVADLHEKRNNFFSDAGFHFVRAGINYWVMDNFTVTAGYGHLWLAPTTPGGKTLDENRIYEQAQLITKTGKISLLQRIRNEQRWQEKIVTDQSTGRNKFTDRVRYLLSFTIPVFKNQWYPSLALADELCVQFGKEVLYNTFDQNRTFIGVKQQVSKSLSFDLGYMLIFQQKNSGVAYDKNHTFRWFFYYTPDWRKKVKTTS